MTEGMTITGLDELRAGVQQLPERVTAALRTVARQTASTVMVRAITNLQTKTHGTGATAAAIHVVEDEANKMFVVESPGVIHQRFSLHTMKRSGRKHTQKVTQDNLPIWLEYGTVKMKPRTYMKPAAEATNAQYIRESEAAALAPVRELLER